MKKLLFATALVASAAAFADGPFSAISFEGYQAGAKFANGATEKAEGGTDKSDGPFFYYAGDGEDASSVKAFGGQDAAAAPANIDRPAYFAAQELTNNKYLDLSTEGGILWRSINNISSQGEAPDPVTYGLGEGEAIPADGLYLDTLVQFTPTEDGGTPELTQGVDKLAIWLNVDTRVTPSPTNLMVRAAYYDAGGTPIATNFVLTGKTVTAGAWYRLTVKAVSNIIDQDGQYGSFYNIPAFIIYIDGDEMAAVDAPIGASLSELDGVIASKFSTLVAEKKVFPSLVPGSGSATLQGVGFKGSGALDDIVWTTEDPFAGGTGGDDAWIAEVTEVFDGANLDSAEKAKITAWASANSITVASGSEEIAAAAYLLGLTSLPAAVPDLTITSIEEGESAWTLTVAASVTTSGTTTDLELPTTINGAITLTQAGTLAGLATATPTTTGFTATVDETVTVTVPKTQAAAAFMKVGVGIAPAAPPANSGN